MRCELVPWMISIVEVDIDKQSCGDEVLWGGQYRPPEDYEGVDLAVECDALAVEDKPRGTR